MRARARVCVRVRKLWHASTFESYPNAVMCRRQAGRAAKPKSKGLHKRQQRAQRVSLRSEDESGSIYQKCGPAAPAGTLVRRKDADPLCAEGNAPKRVVMWAHQRAARRPNGR